MMHWKARLPGTATMLGCALLVSGCAATGRIQPQFPPAADVEQAQQAKPRPTAAIATDEVAREAYNIEIEAWGDRVHDAAVRSCRWMNERGSNFVCGETSAERYERLHD
ncbi:hypothetical protein [Novosphingobium pentaromativorans]|uniref:hypothetical protein n=1 Tax=Novosphingobium pentaromativorans TaxID=205844 RepID=UPI00068E9E15|nr:hypothetical protein [Novosphingobium pentaromativorans]